MNITITESAKLQIKKLLFENNKPAFRITILAGGCSGLMTKFEYSEIMDKDKIFQDDGCVVVIDSKSLLFLQGSTLNYYSDLNESGFKVENISNSKRSCGCGQSFGV
jgi:iron-sulfur cluster assembly accessory protein